MHQTRFYFNSLMKWQSRNNCGMTVGPRQLLGTIILPPQNDTLSTKVLTTILASLTDDYKQIVAYDFTGSSVSGRDLWAYIKSIIVACGERTSHCCGNFRIQPLFPITQYNKPVRATVKALLLPSISNF